VAPPDKSLAAHPAFRVSAELERKVRKCISVIFFLSVAGICLFIPRRMKNHRFATLLAAAAFAAAGNIPDNLRAQEETTQPSLKQSMIGTWEGKAQRDELKLTFAADGKFALISDGKQDSGTWKLDESSTPAKLDLKLSSEGDGYTIVKIDEEGKMHICEPRKTEAKRAKDFSKESDVAILTKSTAKPAPAKGDLKEQIVGSWRGKAGNDEITLTFSADGGFSMDADGEKDKGTYKLDASAKPAKLDVTLDREGKAYTILEITAEGKMRICEPQKDENERAADFNGKASDIAVLEKLGETIPTLEKPENPDPKASEKLVGSWEGAQGKQTMRFTFKAGGGFVFVLTRSSGEKRTIQGTYKTTVSEWPYKLDLKPDENSERKEEAYAVFAFDSAGNLHMAEPKGSEEKRAKDFSGKDAVILKSVEEK
jgi:hypothetical protein